MKYDEEELVCTISSQASLVTAKHYVNNPSAHSARAGLAAKMNMLVHPKDRCGFARMGVGVNLGGSGTKRCTNNNCLTCIWEEPEEDDN